MNLDDLTIGQARELARLLGLGLTGQKMAQSVPHPAVGKYCVIRTYSAGVHAGTVTAVSGGEVTLTDSRRIWSWSGALSCSEIAVTGITGGKVAVSVPAIHLLGVIEIIPASSEAEKCLKKFKIQ